MKNIEGFELIYPDGCKEVNDSLKPDELKRRLTDIMRSLEDHGNERNLNSDTLLNNIEPNLCETTNLKMEGLLMHFTSEMFLDHEDIDIQLRIAVCISNILKLYCPDNPFLSFGDSKSRIKTVLIFLLKCIDEMSKLKSRSDKHFLNLYKIFSIGCQTNLFHWFTGADDSDVVFLEFIRISFNIVRKFPLWSDDNKPMQMLSDSLIVIINSHDVTVPDSLISYLLNFLADRCATKEQKFLSIDIISRCIGKLEDQIQTVLQSQLIKSDFEDVISESSDIEEPAELEDDFCSMAEYQLIKKPKPEVPKPEKPKQKPKKLGKNTIESCVEYSCDHTFQIIYELFKISESIIIPLLPAVEMKLRSPNNVTDRKRACRLLGKLFATFTLVNNNSQLSLWESFIGRFCDIELEVREICVRVAGDVLRRAFVSGDVASGGLSGLISCQDDLVKALQKRSHDQEETIRYQLVRTVSQLFATNSTILRNDPLDSVNETLLRILLDRTRDKSLLVRKEANASLGKLYQRIVTSTDEDHDPKPLGIGVDRMSAALRTRLETLLVHILRLYPRNEVEDKIIVERLFHTYLVPYQWDAATRMRALLDCFTVSDEPSLMSIQELFKTQVMILNVMRDTITLIKESNSEKVLSPSVSQKMKEKVKRLSEFLPSKDKVESLTKFFVLIRADKKLFGFVSKLVSPDSSRDVLVKSISDIKKHLSTPASKSSNAETNPANIQKKKAFKNTIKCLLERCAPIIMDIESGQELVCLLVSTNESLESSTYAADCSKSIYRAMKLLHVVSIIYRNSVPTLDAYCFIASVISRLKVQNTDQLNTESELSDTNDDKQTSTPSSTMSIKSVTATQKNVPNSVEELCLLTLARIINFRSSYEQPADNNNTEEDSAKDHTSIPEHSKPVGLFSGESDQLLNQTRHVLAYLSTCANNGSTHPQMVADNKPLLTTNSKVATDQDGDREHCIWKYNARVAKLATRCLIGLYFCCQLESRGDTSVVVTEILSILEARLDELMKDCSDCVLFSPKQTIMLSTLSQLGLHLRRRYGTQIHFYVQNTVLMRILTEENESATQVDQPEPVMMPRNLSSWVSNSAMSVATQVRVQSLKMLSKWMVTLRVDEDRNLILSVMVCLRKYIGSYGNPQYSGPLIDGDMAQMRLAAGKCWLRLAQVQSFLSIFDVKWLHRLSSLIYDPCVQVRDGFLRKLHKGLFRLQLPLDYMAMFAFVPLISSPEFLITAKNFFAANVTRRREFLDRNPHYLTDAKLLFAVLPEYVLAFIIHMLAHDSHWTDVDDPTSIHRVKQCLWFVMEPILKLNENSSFIRKLLEKIKHAQDASEPTNDAVNEKIYICCDIALGLLISKQASYDLKEYPVELRLPRTRYVPAPNLFFNPDFANILLDNPTRVRVQFSPTHKSKQMIMNFMPAPLIKGHTTLNVPAIITAPTTVLPSTSGPIHTNSEEAIITKDIQEQETVAGNTVSCVDQQTQRIPQPIKSSSISVSKPKKHVARIVVGLPEIESESVPTQSVSISKSFETSRVVKKAARNVRKTRLGSADSSEQRSPKRRRRKRRSESPVIVDDAELLRHIQGSGSPLSAGAVTKHGRVVRPNSRVMKDMVSLAAIPIAVRRSPVNTSVASLTSQSTPVSRKESPHKPVATVRIESTVSVSLPRILTTFPTSSQVSDNNISDDIITEPISEPDSGDDDNSKAPMDSETPSETVTSLSRKRTRTRTQPTALPQQRPMPRRLAKDQAVPLVVDALSNAGISSARNWRYSKPLAPVEQAKPTRISSRRSIVTEKATKTKSVVSDKASQRVAENALKVAEKENKITKKTLEVAAKEPLITDQPTKVTERTTKATKKVMEAIPKEQLTTEQVPKVIEKAVKLTEKSTKKTADVIEKELQATENNTQKPSPSPSKMLNQLTRQVLTRRARSFRVIDHRVSRRSRDEPLSENPPTSAHSGDSIVDRDTGAESDNKGQSVNTTRRKKPTERNILETSVSKRVPSKTPSMRTTRAALVTAQVPIPSMETKKTSPHRKTSTKKTPPETKTISALTPTPTSKQKARIVSSPVSSSPKRSVKSSVSSPIDIVWRSKRIASQTATEQLVTKKPRNV